MPPSPQTYLIYGHGSFDSQSIVRPVHLPPGCELHFSVGHLKEIGDRRMVDIADLILDRCADRAAGHRAVDWWNEADITELFYETFDTPNQAIPDYILGDTYGLYAPTLDLYRSPQAMVIINPPGATLRLSQILGSPHWRNRHPVTHFVWCGCRAFGFRAQIRPHHRDPEWNRFRNDLILEL